VCRAGRSIPAHSLLPRRPSTSSATLSARAGHREPQIIQRDEAGDRTAGFIRGLLKRVVVYQFHNTSLTARIRGKHPVEDNRLLKEDAANLAACLYRISDTIYDAGQASDGMLRFIALVTLLLQPQDALPAVLILDEPELGLHPYAIPMTSLL